MDNKNNNLNLLKGMAPVRESSDLATLKEAEEKIGYQGNIAKEEKNPLVYRAMVALKLSNPFKGY